MKAQVNGIEVEGTPAEVAEFVREMKTVLVMDDVTIDEIADQLMEAMKMPQRIVVEEEPEPDLSSEEITEKMGLSSAAESIKEQVVKNIKWEPAPMPELHGPTTPLFLPDAWKSAKVVDGGIKLDNSDIVGYSPIADFSTADHTAHMTISLSPKMKERQGLKNFLGDINWSALPFTIAANEEERDYPFAVPNLYFDYVDRMFVVNNVEEAARLISGYVTARHMNQKECEANEVDSDDDES